MFFIIWVTSLIKIHVSCLVFLCTGCTRYHWNQTYSRKIIRKQIQEARKTTYQLKIRRVSCQDPSKNLRHVDLAASYLCSSFSCCFRICSEALLDLPSQGFASWLMINLQPLVTPALINKQWKQKNWSDRQNPTESTNHCASWRNHLLAMETANWNCNSGIWARRFPSWNNIKTIKMYNYRVKQDH